MNLETKIANTNFKHLFDIKGYTYFLNGSYNLNIIGVRSSNIVNKNNFSDFIVVEYRDDNGNFCQKRFMATTTPGIYWLENLMNPKGCAILCPGQYRSAFTFGKHKGQYSALVQYSPLTVARDRNKDNILDKDAPKDTGMFGINIHKAGQNSIQVDKWSAGCQVFKRSNDFSTFLNICHLQDNHGKGKTFTYTLIDEEDLDLV